MSAIEFDKPLDKPLTQTILPIMSESGLLFGFVPIAKTVFEDPLPAIQLASGFTVQARSVTLPNRPHDGSYMFVPQYIAVVYTLQQASYKPWLGLPDMVSNNDQGYYSSYKMPAGALIHHFGRGTMLEALATGMDTSIGSALVSSIPAGTPIGVAWTSTVNIQALSTVSFFDFSWLELWRKTAPASIRDEAVIRIEVRSNPASGIFKASVVPSKTVVLGTLMFDTIRVLRLANAAPSIYLFTFEVTTVLGKYPCTLTLTVTP